MEWMERKRLITMQAPVGKAAMHFYIPMGVIKLLKDCYIAIDYYTCLTLYIFA